MSSICLAYDNMCHMDSLKIAKADLPLPKPFHEAWKLVTKVINRLHIRNHVDPKCHKLYNADDKVPKQFNTMACEQTFIWASRFKKVMCAMPHVHHLFFCTGLYGTGTDIPRNVTVLGRHQFSQKLAKVQTINFYVNALYYTVHFSNLLQ